MAEPAPEMPKIELKMMVLPVLFLLQKQIDLKDPVILNYVHIGLASSTFIALGTYFFIYQAIKSKNNQKKIWIPPKPIPSIPFISPPSQGPPKPEEYTETTYDGHEQKLLLEALQGVVFSCALAAFMSYKFGVHFSCLMQGVLIPVGLYENILVQKYIFGSTKPNLYNELDAPPAQISDNAAAASDDEDENVPRVEEVDEEPTTTTTTTTNTGAGSQSTSTSTTTNTVLDEKKGDDLPSSDDDDTVKVEKSDANDID